MEELKLIICEIRNYVKTEREKTSHLTSVDVFFLAMLEISTTLTELAIYQNREISHEEEENWFKGSYHLDFWDSDLNNNFYKPLIEKVKECNYFRN